MKKKFTIFFIQLFISALFALDYRQVLFSNNFERIEQINDENIVNNYLNKIKQSYIKIVSNEPFREEYRELKYFRLYKEIFENIVIYRLVGCSEKITDTNIENQNLKNISQLIFYENTGNIYLIDYAVFHYTPEGGGMYTAYFTDDYYGLETIERSNNLKGIMKHHSENMKEVHSDEDSSQKTINYSGFSNAKYYEWSDLQNPKKYALISSNVYLFDSYNNHIEIHSTRPLIDKKRPLMYTIQNAFDGNPATAYVEDTGSSNIGITIKMKEERSLLMLAIINGYGENIDLYKANNSIKELEIGDDYSTNEVIKLNNMVDIQKLPTKAYKNSSFCVFSRNLYKGTKYDDTCIAELNLCFKKFGWLFGE